MPCAPFILKNLKTVRDLSPKDRFENEADIDIGNFRYLFEEYWDDVFKRLFDRYRDVRSAVGIITEARNQVAHPGIEDIPSGYTLSRLHEITDILGRINAPEQKREVEAIRDKLLARIAPTVETKPIRPKPSPANDIIDPKPIEPEAIIAGEWTIERVKNSLPQEVREYHEAKFSEDRCNIFYGRVAETQNLVQAKGWLLDVNFTTRYCGFKNKKRLVFGVRITFSPPRFFAKITEEEAGGLSNQYKYDSGRKSAFYTIPENVSELLPVLEFAYNKHRGS